ncbi:MAG TPA: hypothetical protein VGK52_06910, partial [Polyangia bacterium]
GSCSSPDALDGTACSDGDACTDPDTCQAGSCQPGPTMVCVDPMQMCVNVGPPVNMGVCM